MSEPGSKSSSDALKSAALPVSDSTDPTGLAPVVDVNDRTQIINTNDLKPPPPQAMFKVLVLAGPKAGSEFLIDTEEFTVGRAVENIVSIPDVSVSRKHARFVRKDGGFEVSDLQSGNGVKLNGKPITTAQAGHGDELILGDTVLQVIDLSAPLPERMKPIHTLQSPSGHSGPPNSTTQLESLKPFGSSGKAEKTPPPPPPVEPEPKVEAKKPEPEKTAPPPPKEPVRKAAPAAGGSNKRVKLYVAVGALMVVFFAVAAVMKPPEGPQPPPDPDPDAEVWPEEVVKAREHARKHDWVAALAALEPLKKSENPVAKRWLEAVPKEVESQKKLRNATAALNGHDFRSARALAEGIKEEADVYPQAQALIESINERVASSLGEARTAWTGGNRDRALELVNSVLLFEPENADAQSLKAEITRPVETAKPTPTPTTKVAIATPTPTPTPTPKKAEGFEGPWLQAYLDNRVSEAMLLAEGSAEQEIRGKFLSLLRDFRQNYTQGMQAAQSKRVPEAAKFLNVAFNLDKQIAGKASENKPGPEVRKLLANMEYILSLDCKGDDQLGLQAGHLRTALSADPSHELSLKAQKVAFDRAREIYREGYVDRTNDPVKAKRQFKIAVAVLPAGDETREKAQYWIDKMDGKNP